MHFYHAEPEVAGELGPKTEYLSTFPTTVGVMEYRFDRWPADEFVQAHPCYAVSQRLKDQLQSADLTGCRFEPAVVGVMDNFVGAAESIPRFHRLIPAGIPFVDDFGLNAAHELVVSARAKAALEKAHLSRCIFQIPSQ